MAEEEIAAAAAPSPSDHKRKHEHLESEGTEPPPSTVDSSANANANANANASDSVKREEEEEEEVKGGDTDESEAKRPRLEDKPDGLAENGFQEKVVEALEENDEQPSAENNTESEDVQQPAEEVQEMVDNEQPSTADQQTEDIQPPSDKNPQLESAQQQPSGEELQEPSAEASQEGDVSSGEQQLASENQPMSRKMEVPNNKVGVLIGKSGDTIRFLQINSGAKIQITRDADADPYSATRHVELVGSLENITKAEKLIKDVIAEADAGGSPSLVARGFSTVQAAGAVEQITIQVPNEKVGLIIGKGGETIKNLQTRSGARIQLIPQHLPEGDQSKERTVRVSGDKKQIETAREMIKEVMNQPARPSLSGGYNQQQGYRPHGPAQPQWGSRGPHPAQPTGYDYQQRGPYQSQNSQYPPQGYGNYLPQQVAPRSGFGQGWDQRPASTMQGPPPQSGVGYDYYGGQGHHMVDAPASNPAHAHGGPGPSPTPMGPPPSQGNYNYGQQAPYSQTAPPQSYGHGYNEAKYENQAPSHYPYGGHGGPQQGGYPQNTYPGYAPQDQYGKQQSYGMQPQGPPSQHYGQPRASQPGDNVPYQGPISSAQPYGQNAPPQQTYPQTYPQYGSQAPTDGYNQLQPATGPAPVYPQQGGHPVSGYGQPGGQQALGYVQAGPTGGYGSYPSSQPGGYTEQPAQNNAGYAYQGAVEPAYGGAPAGTGYGAPPTGQAGYPQPAPAQPGYDQSVPHSGAYGSVPGGASVGYGKSASPQAGYPQYDTTQMLGTHR
ncbi:Far upstream element-binding protein like [Actinidia chinensis var. chinensis]|uniref:Far upstream element-binding protein like n=1 Tax=Actinidia chinensis var. chinensis TaxID=1590841 RepID=A0A2R6R2A8_ACTCC|nr:Far upstream element-binding protein like [Actinidia chinensis var. chinensis]